MTPFVMPILAAGLLAAGSVAAFAEETIRGADANRPIQDREQRLPIPDACLDGLDPDGNPCETLSDRLDRTDSVIAPPAGIDPEMQVTPPDPTPNTTPVIPPGAIDPQQPGDGTVVPPPVDVD